MNVLPLNIILTTPIPIQILYFFLCFVIAIIGINRKMGFWGYLFFSILFSPLIGFIVVMVSASTNKKNIKQKEVN